LKRFSICCLPCSKFPESQFWPLPKTHRPSQLISGAGWESRAATLGETPATLGTAHAHWLSNPGIRVYREAPLLPFSGRRAVPGAVTEVSCCGAQPAPPLSAASAKAWSLRAGAQGARHGGAAGGGGWRDNGRGECGAGGKRWGAVPGRGGRFRGDGLMSLLSAHRPLQGGQILRVSTALSCLLGLPLRVQKIRAGRSTPGLR
jgi:hypothetical protein